MSRAPGAKSAPVLNLDGLGSAIAPVFRTVSVDGRRKGLRLETVFWTILDDLAQRLGIKRSALVAGVIAGSESPGINAASIVRCYAAAGLLAEVEKLRALADEATVIPLMQQGPTPSFAINRQRRLKQVNAEFVQFLLVLSGNMDQSRVIDTAQLTLDTPLDQLFETFRHNSKPLQCGYTVRIEQRQRRGIARVAPVPPWPASALVGYILS